MKVFIEILLVFFVTIGCQQNKPIDDPEKIKQVLFDYFDGIKTKDIQKLNDATTPEFVIFEDGKVWNNDSIMALLSTLPKYTIDYTFDNFKIKMDNASGRMNYFNHADLILNDTTHMQFNWLESATFRKEADKWKMEFLHSTVRK